MPKVPAAKELVEGGSSRKSRAIRAAAKRARQQLPLVGKEGVEGASTRKSRAVRAAAERPFHGVAELFLGAHSTNELKGACGTKLGQNIEWKSLKGIYSCLLARLRHGTYRMIFLSCL